MLVTSCSTLLDSHVNQTKEYTMLFLIQHMQMGGIATKLRFDLVNYCMVMRVVQ